jgi:hypothetical protein
MEVAGPGGGVVPSEEEEPGRATRPTMQAVRADAERSAHRPQRGTVERTLVGGEASGYSVLGAGRVPPGPREGLSPPPMQNRYGFGLFLGLSSGPQA